MDLGVGRRALWPPVEEEVAEATAAAAKRPAMTLMMIKLRGYGR